MYLQLSKLLGCAIVPLCVVALIAASANAQQPPKHASTSDGGQQADDRDGAEPTPSRGIGGPTGPYVPFPEYTAPAKANNREWTSVEIVLSISVLVFGVICLSLQSLLILKMGDGWDAKSVLRMTSLTLIISSALVLITAGYSAEQVAPVMGLLGTIAGYLLGSGEKGEKPQ